MHNIISNLIWICPIISLLSLILLACINIYKLIRRNFPVKVNCWFCNQWTKVSYDDQNCFECPTCLQYNGFNLDGGYNRTLPAQYDEHLNKTIKQAEKQSKILSSNGLCRICNNNQQLRVFQLANFIPLNEANFDVEIEHFEKQLDKAYKLCDKCESFVKKTIAEQHSKLGIKLSELGQKGISFMDLTISSNGFSSHAKRSVFKKILFCTIVFFASLNIIHLLMQFNSFTASLKKILPAYGKTFEDLHVFISSTSIRFWNTFLASLGDSSALNFVQRHILEIYNYDFVQELCTVLQVILMDILDYLSEFSFNASTDSSILLYFVGTLLQFIWLFVNFASFKKNFFLVLIWIGLLCLESGHFQFDEYTEVLQIAFASLILCLMLVGSRQKPIKMKKKCIKKAAKNEVLGNISDDETMDFCSSSSNELPVKMNEVKPVFSSASLRKTLFCDKPTAIKSRNSIDLDVSLDKLHIGSQTTKKSILKMPLVNVNSVRPKPVLSPAKLQNVSPGPWSKTSLGDYNQCVSCNETDPVTLRPSPNAFFDGLGYQSLFPDSLFNIASAAPVFGKHVSICCPRFSYANSAPFQPLLNNEQLVYIAPNFVPSSNVFEVFPNQTLSSDNYDTAYSDKFISRKLSDVFHSELLQKK